MALEKLKDELYRCIVCSECYGRGPNLPFKDAAASTPYWICPILEKYGFQSYSPRGIQFIANKIYYDNFPITEDLVKVVYSCVSCNLCGTQCTRPFMDIFRALKEEMTLKGVAAPPRVRKVNRNISDSYNFMGAKPESRTRWAEGLNLPKTSDLVFFPGCYESFRQPQVSQAIIKVLRASGLDIAYLAEDEWCCGMIPGWSGEPRIEVEMARHNIEALEKARAKRVVTNCAECYRTFVKEYPKIAGELPFEVVHTSQLLSELLASGKLKLTKELKEKVTYHDPCFLGRHCNVYNEPRAVIAAIPGIQFAEMESNRLFANCCGNGAEVTALSFPEMEEHNAKKRIAEAKAVATTIVTTCPRCVATLNRTANKTNSKMKVEALIELVARTLE